MAEHGPDEHVERVVLLDVVTGHQEVTAKDVRKDERRGRKTDQDCIGPQWPDVDTCCLHELTIFT